MSKTQSLRFTPQGSREISWPNPRDFVCAPWHSLDSHFTPVRLRLAKKVGVKSYRSSINGRWRFEEVDAVSLKLKKPAPHGAPKVLTAANTLAKKLAPQIHPRLHTYKYDNMQPHVVCTHVSSTASTAPASIRLVSDAVITCRIKVQIYSPSRF